MTFKTPVFFSPSGPSKTTLLFLNLFSFHACSESLIFLALLSYAATQFTNVRLACKAMSSEILVNWR